MHLQESESLKFYKTFWYFNSKGFVFFFAQKYSKILSASLLSYLCKKYAQIILALSSFVCFPEKKNYHYAS